MFFYIDGAENKQVTYQLDRNNWNSRSIAGLTNVANLVSFISEYFSFWNTLPIRAFVSCSTHTHIRNRLPACCKLLIDSFSSTPHQKAGMKKKMRGFKFKRISDMMNPFSSDHNQLSDSVSFVLDYKDQETLRRKSI